MKISVVTRSGKELFKGGVELNDSATVADLQEAIHKKNMQNKMNRKFGGGKLATGTPSLGWSCVVVVCSLLGGASIVHNIYKPNLTLPPIEEVSKGKQKEKP